MAHNVTLIPGDGIGPEVAMAAKRVVDASGAEINWHVVDAGESQMEKYGTRVVPSTPAAAPSRLQAKPLDEEDDCEEEDPRDSIAETLIRWVPPITAIVCAGIALCGFVYSQFMM